MQIIAWVGFLTFVLAMLAIDLGIFHRQAHVVRAKEAFAWTGVWVFLALCFNALLWPIYDHHWLGLGAGGEHVATSGKDAALEFLAGYLVEKSLSLDNVFIIALIFTHFRVPALLQHRVLVWGVLGALVMRGIMIFAGAALLARFEWVSYLFGALLIYTAVKLLISKHEEFNPERNPLFRFAARLFPISRQLDGQKFFTTVDGRRAVTPLFLVLIVVESSDLLFAIDSIPAIFSITRDPFIVFTSNIFAILGLRSLYFALADVIDRFRYLKTSLVYLLSFVGVKMLIARHHHIPIAASLAVIFGILSIGVLASIAASRRDAARRP